MFAGYGCVLGNMRRVSYTESGAPSGGPLNKAERQRRFVWFQLRNLKREHVSREWATGLGITHDTETHREGS